MIWGLFASYRDALAALEDFRRQGLEPEDLAGLVQVSALRAQVPTSQGKAASSSQPRQQAKQTEQAGAAAPRLPGGETVRLPGTSPLIASGTLARALREASARKEESPAPATHGKPLNDVLAILGLPPGYVAIYANGVRAGQTLVLARVGDQQERDAVDTMRRHRVANLAGLIAA